MRKLLAAILFTIIAAVPSVAQTSGHYTLWSRLRIAHVFSPKWETEADLQYRRQGDGDANILALPLAYSVRLWAYYRPVPKWTIGFSPFTWFHNYALVNTSADKLKGWEEYRIYLYGEYRLSIARKLILFNRVGAEPMYQQRSWGDRSFTRLRWREQLNLQVWPATQIFAGSELFINSFASEKMSVYNQGRLFTGIQYHASKHLMLTGGYMLQHIYTQTDKSYQISHDLTVGAHIHL